VNGGEVFETIGRQDGDAIATRKAASRKRPGYRVGLAFEIAVAEAALAVRAEIDNRDLAI
jgi:hypothetical protein